MRVAPLGQRAEVVGRRFPAPVGAGDGVAGVLGAEEEVARGVGVGVLGMGEGAKEVARGREVGPLREIGLHVEGEVGERRANFACGLSEVHVAPLAAEGYGFLPAGFHYSGAAQEPGRGVGCARGVGDGGFARMSQCGVETQAQLLRPDCAAARQKEEQGGGEESVEEVHGSISFLGSASCLGEKCLRFFRKAAALFRKSGSPFSAFRAGSRGARWRRRRGWRSSICRQTW